MSALTLRINETEEALDEAQAALGKVIRTMGDRAELSVFYAYQDIYRDRKALTVACRGEK